MRQALNLKKLTFGTIMNSQSTRANRVSRRRPPTIPPRQVDPRRHRRQPPKPLEVVAVVILLTLICILGFILISGFFASFGTVIPLKLPLSPTANPGIAQATATPFQPDGEQVAQPGEGEQTEDLSRRHLPPQKTSSKNRKARSISFC